MALTDVNRDSVLAAAAEYDQLGQDAFLANYGFRPARKYVLLLDGKTYDSKALARRPAIPARNTPPAAAVDARAVPLAQHAASWRSTRPLVMSSLPGLRQ